MSEGDSSFNVFTCYFKESFTCFLNLNFSQVETPRAAYREKSNASGAHPVDSSWLLLAVPPHSPYIPSVLAVHVLLEPGFKLSQLVLGSVDHL